MSAAGGLWREHEDGYCPAGPLIAASSRTGSGAGAAAGLGPGRSTAAATAMAATTRPKAIQKARVIALGQGRVRGPALCDQGAGPGCGYGRQHGQAQRAADLAGRVHQARGQAGVLR